MKNASVFYSSHSRDRIDEARNVDHRDCKIFKRYLSRAFSLPSCFRLANTWPVILSDAQEGVMHFYTQEALRR